MRTPREIGILTILLSLGCSLSFADEIRIPVSVKVDDFKNECKKSGFDLNEVDGFVENKGQRFIVYTYKSVTDQQLEIIKDAAWKTKRN